MSYVRLLPADILPRGSKNNVLQLFGQFLLRLTVTYSVLNGSAAGLFGQFLLGLPVTIHGCNIKNRVTRCENNWVAKCEKIRVAKCENNRVTR